MKATAKERLVKEGWYDYEKGTEFIVLDIKPRLTLVEDFLGIQHWIKTELLELAEPKFKVGDFVKGFNWIFQVTQDELANESTLSFFKANAEHNKHLTLSSIKEFELQQSKIK